MYKKITTAFEMLLCEENKINLRTFHGTFQRNQWGIELGVKQVKTWMCLEMCEWRNWKGWVRAKMLLDFTSKLASINQIIIPLI